MYKKNYLRYVRTTILIIFILLMLSLNGNAQTSCINCHQELEDNLKVSLDQLKDDIHHKNEVGCTECHGGDADVRYEDDAEKAMDPRKGYIGKPKKRNIPKLCSKCHSSAKYMRDYNPNMPTDQYQQYLTSQHGMLLVRGDKKVAVCSDCHGVHDIQPANVTTSSVFPNNIAETCGHCHSDEEYMKEYGIPSDQQKLYQKSVHGINLYEKGDRSSPTCNDCHGNHGAFPPGVSSISHVCGVCHVIQADMFSKSPHKSVFEEMDLPQCESCHGNHDVEPTYPDMLGVGPKSFCINCHDEDSKGYEVAKAMKAIEDTLIYKISLADSLLEIAEKAGVEVSEGKFVLKDADDELVKARSAVHFFSLEKFSPVIEKGYQTADEAVKNGELALKELRNRRRWLAIVSILIFISAVSLYFKIKEMKRD